MRQSAAGCALNQGGLGTAEAAEIAKVVGIVEVVEVVELVGTAPSARGLQTTPDSQADASHGQEECAPMHDDWPAR